MNTLQEYIYKYYFKSIKSELSGSTENIKVYQITPGSNEIGNLIALTEKEYKTYMQNTMFIETLQKIHQTLLKVNSI